MADAILALNAGSSSIKFALYRLTAADGIELAAKGAVEGIGTAPRLTARDAFGATLAANHCMRLDRLLGRGVRPHMRLAIAAAIRQTVTFE